jgi:hypothetical protein
VVVFGKAASVTYAKCTGKKLKAHRTYWSIKFTNVCTARAFEIIVKHLTSQTANNEEVNQTEVAASDEASKATNKEENAEGANGGKEEVDEVSVEAKQVSWKQQSNSLLEETKESLEEDNE